MGIRLRFRQDLPAANALFKKAIDGEGLRTLEKRTRQSLVPGSTQNKSGKTIYRYELDIPKKDEHLDGGKENIIKELGLDLPHGGESEAYARECSGRQNARRSTRSRH